ncbi:MAG: hypothetical protein LC687_02600 [Actinobacteria bacterium]|nr:hypothetical protein [Actinomycetota bacterium]MCA1806742.1 hypothetical protein [Actinomycetota bacterium]
MGWKAELYPQAMPAIRAHLGKTMERTALVGAEELDKKIARGTRSGDPVSAYEEIEMRARESAPGEFPQEQTGELRRSLDVRPGSGGTEFLIGFFDTDQEKLLDIEFGPPEQGGRPLLGQHFTDMRTHGAMNLYIYMKGPRI